MPILSDVEYQQCQVQINIESAMKDLHGRMVFTFNQVMDLVWNNPNLTPQQVMDAFGPRAAELFQLAGLCQNTIETALPGTNLLQPTVVFTINNDGTVTVTG